jgi:secreted trypsin-like serine protease
MLKMGDHWFLRGVVSYGKSTKGTIDGVPVCRGKYPSVYADVAYYMPWIVEKANLL